MPKLTSVSLIAALFVYASATGLAAQEIFNVRVTELSEKQTRKWWSAQFELGRSIVETDKFLSHQFLMFPDESQDEMASYRALYKDSKKVRRLGWNSKMIRGVVSEAALKADLPDSFILDAGGEGLSGLDDFSKNDHELVRFAHCVASSDESLLWKLLETEAASSDEIQASQLIVDSNKDCARTVGLTGLLSTELRLATAEVLYVRRANTRQITQRTGQEAAE